MSALAPTLQAFFTQRLMAQRHASAHTVAAYRDTFRLLLGFVEEQAGGTPGGPGHRGPGRAEDLGVPWITSNAVGATPCGPATLALQRSTRCSASPRCAIPSTPN